MKSIVLVGFLCLQASVVRSADAGFELDLLLCTAMTSHAVSELDEPTDLKELAYTKDAASIGLAKTLRISETILGTAAASSTGEIHFYRQLPAAVNPDHVVVWLDKSVEGGSKRGKLATR